MQPLSHWILCRAEMFGLFLVQTEFFLCLAYSAMCVFFPHCVIHLWLRNLEIHGDVLTAFLCFFKFLWWTCVKGCCGSFLLIFSSSFIFLVFCFVVLLGCFVCLFVSLLFCNGLNWIVISKTTFSLGLSSIRQAFWVFLIKISYLLSQSAFRRDERFEENVCWWNGSFCLKMKQCGRGMGAHWADAFCLWFPCH